MNNTYLNGIINRLDNVTEKVTVNFNMLNADQINRKHSPDSWSIGQCLDHIIVTNNRYFPKIMAVGRGEKDAGIGTKIPLLPVLIGKLLTGTVRPDAKMKVKAPKIFQPSKGDIQSDIVNQFRKHQEQLREQIIRSDIADHKKTLITSPVSKFFGLYLYDAVNILTLHEERHLLQAMRVFNNENIRNN